jgi:hypothetical protein
MLEIADTLFLILVNSTSEKELANLGQTPPFLFGDLQQSSFDLARDPESDAFVFRRHDFARILDPQECPVNAFFP